MRSYVSNKLALGLKYTPTRRYHQTGSAQSYAPTLWCDIRVREMIETGTVVIIAFGNSSCTHSPVVSPKLYRCRTWLWGFLCQDDIKYARHHAALCLYAFHCLEIASDWYYFYAGPMRCFYLRATIEAAMSYKCNVPWQGSDCFSFL